MGEHWRYFKYKYENKNETFFQTKVQVKNEAHNVKELESDHLMVDIFHLHIFLPQKELRSQIF